MQHMWSRRWSNTSEHGTGRKWVIFRIDGEPAIRALRGDTIRQEPRGCHRVLTPALENMNKELCGLVRCFRIYLREKAEPEITTESPLLPYFGWVLSRYAVRSDGRTGYSRLKAREYTADISIFGELIWHRLPKTADLTKLDDCWRTATCLGKSDLSDEHIMGFETGAVLARSVRRKVEGKRWYEKALKMDTGTPWNPRPGDVVVRRRYITRALAERYGPTEDSSGCFRKSQHQSERCRARFELRLAPHLVNIGQRAECEAMVRHQLFERVLTPLARGKKVKCQWLDEMKQGSNGPLVRSRLVEMEVVHGNRYIRRHSTSQMHQDHHLEGCADKEQERQTHSRARSCRHQRWHPPAATSRRANLDVSATWCRGSRILVATEASDVWDETCIASLPRAHEVGSRRSRLCSAEGLSPGSLLP